MKKSTIALSVIGLLAAAEIGGAWFTGQKAQEHYERLVTRVNSELQQGFLNSLWHIEVKNTQFERGFFSSKLTDEIILTNNENGEQVTLPIDATLYHGPFPLNRLAKFDLVPKLFAVEGQLAQSDALQPLFAATQSDKPLQFDGAVGYGLGTSATVNLVAGSLKNEVNTEEGLTWDNTALHIDLDKDLKGDVRLQNPKFNFAGTLTDNQGNKNKAQLAWNYLDLHLVMGAADQLVYLPEGKSSLKMADFQWQLQPENGKGYQVALKNLQTSSENRFTDNFVNQTLEFKSDSFFNNEPLGQFAYHIELNHFDSQALNELLHLLTQQAEHSNESTAKAAELGLTILNNEPQVRISPLQLTDNAGKAQLELLVSVVKDPQFNLMKKGLLQQFKDFDLNIMVDKATAINVLSVISPEDKANASAIVDKWAQNVAHQGLAVNNEKDVSLKLAIKEGNLSLNGQIIPEEQLQGVLFMMLMGMSIR